MNSSSCIAEYAVDKRAKRAVERVSRGEGFWFGAFPWILLIAGLAGLAVGVGFAVRAAMLPDAYFIRYFNDGVAERPVAVGLPLVGGAAWALMLLGGAHRQANARTSIRQHERLCFDGRVLWHSWHLAGDAEGFVAPGEGYIFTGTHPHSRQVFAIDLPASSVSRTPDGCFFRFEGGVRSARVGSPADVGTLVFDDMRESGPYDIGDYFGVDLEELAAKADGD